MLRPILRLDDNIELKGDWMAREKSDTVIQYDEISHMLKQFGVSFNQTVLKDCLQALTQTLMDIEVSQILDASRYERNATRRAYRNGYRSTVWVTSIGNIELRVPKLRRGTYYPDRILNDSQVSEVLIHLIVVCLVHGINDSYVAQTLSGLDLVRLSPYEIHQVCDAIRVHLLLSDNTIIVRDNNGLARRLSDNYSRHRLLNGNQHTEAYIDRMSTNVRLRRDREFWKDFVRRLLQAGLIVENHQSLLSSVNPYAVLQFDESNPVLHFDFADHIHSLYKEDYQEIA